MRPAPDPDLPETPDRLGSETRHATSRPAARVLRQMLARVREGDHEAAAHLYARRWGAHPHPELLLDDLGVWPIGWAGAFFAPRLWPASTAALDAEGWPVYPLVVQTLADLDAYLDHPLAQVREHVVRRHGSPSDLWAGEAWTEHYPHLVDRPRLAQLPSERVRQRLETETVAAVVEEMLVQCGRDVIDVPQLLHHLQASSYAADDWYTEEEEESVHALGATGGPPVAVPGTRVLSTAREACFALARRRDLSTEDWTRLYGVLSRSRPALTALARLGQRVTVGRIRAALQVTTLPRAGQVEVLAAAAPSSRFSAADKAASLGRFALDAARVAGPEASAPPGRSGLRREASTRIPSRILDDPSVVARLDARERAALLRCLEREQRLRLLATLATLEQQQRAASTAEPPAPGPRRRAI